MRSILVFSSLILLTSAAVKFEKWLEDLQSHVGSDPTQVARLSDITAASAPALLFAQVDAGQNINLNDEVIDVTFLRNDIGWNFDATNFEFSYTGTANYLEIYTSVYCDLVVGQRVSPCVELQEGIGGTWTVVEKSCTGYMRNASLHRSSSNSFQFTVINPSPTKSYRIVAQRGSSLANPTLETSGHVSAKAF